MLSFFPVVRARARVIQCLPPPPPPRRVLRLTGRRRLIKDGFSFFFFFFFISTSTATQTANLPRRVRSHKTSRRTDDTKCICTTYINNTCDGRLHHARVLRRGRNRRTDSVNTCRMCRIHSTRSLLSSSADRETFRRFYRRAAFDYVLLCVRVVYGSYYTVKRVESIGGDRELHGTT